MLAEKYRILASAFTSHAHDCDAHDARNTPRFTAHTVWEHPHHGFLSQSLGFVVYKSRGDVPSTYLVSTTLFFLRFIKRILDYSLSSFVIDKFRDNKTRRLITANTFSLATISYVFSEKK